MRARTVYRLSDSAFAEPLVNQWAAWSFLVAPVPASLHLAHYQIPVMESYVSDPIHHFRASQDARLVGGPFINVPPERAGEIQDLLDASRALHRTLALARALRRFQNWLADEAHGQSLEPYYPKIPGELQGVVELVYDYHNRASLRFFEPLLYSSPYYREEAQSLRLGLLRSDSDRRFFMNTPRLSERGQIDWPTPFRSADITELFGLDTAPKPLDAIREMLGIRLDEAALKDLLSEGPVEFAEPWNGDKIRLRYFGHACVLVEHKGLSLLTDPCIGVLPAQGGPGRLSYRDLPLKINYALVTHNHQDHFVIETLLRLRDRIECLLVPRSGDFLYGDISLKLLAQRLGYKKVMEIGAFDRLTFPDGEIVAVPFLGEHGDLAHSKVAYVVRVGCQRILFAADSDCLDPGIYENVRRMLGSVQTAFVGTESVGAPLSWTCGPLLSHKPTPREERERRYHGCNAARALQMLDALKTNRVFNYAMGIEPWMQHILGLGLQSDSPQILEADQMLRIARERKFLAAERLYGHWEYYLDPDEKLGDVLHCTRRTSQSRESPTISQSASDADHQFKFD